MVPSVSPKIIITSMRIFNREFGILRCYIINNMKVHFESAAKDRKRVNVNYFPLVNVLMVVILHPKDRKYSSKWTQGYNLTLSFTKSKIAVICAHELVIINIVKNLVAEVWGLSFLCSKYKKMQR